MVFVMKAIYVCNTVNPFHAHDLPHRYIMRYYKQTWPDLKGGFHASAHVHESNPIQVFFSNHVFACEKCNHLKKSSTVKFSQANLSHELSGRFRMVHKQIIKLNGLFGIAGKGEKYFELCKCIKP